jgi:hypothetical protein
MKSYALARRIFRIVFSTALSCAVFAGTAYATPSTQIWIPSTDIQPYKTFHLNIDSYVRTKKEPTSNVGYFGIADGSAIGPMYLIGPTVGILPFEKLQAEVGFDLMWGGANTPAGLDKYPFYGHFKLGTPEDNTWKPAVAVGMYNIGLKKGEVNNGVYTKSGTDADIYYGLVAKTFPVIGRLSAGYYGLNKKASVAGVYDRNGAKGDDSGLLLSWDRTMSEISDKLWFAVDHQGGKNAYGATNVGFSWAFAKNVSVIFGYDIYNNKDRAGQNTFTVQVDINFP